MMRTYSAALAVILEVTMTGQPHRVGYALEGTLAIATATNAAGTMFTVQIPTPAGTWTCTAGLFELELDPNPIEGN